MIADEVEYQVANELATILDIVEEAVERLFYEATHNAHWGIHIVV